MMNTNAITLLAFALAVSPALGQTLSLPAEDLLPGSHTEELSLTEFDPVVPTIAPFAPTINDQQMLVDLYLKLEDYPAAETAADQLLAKHPRDPVALSAKTSIALRNQDVIASLQWAEKYRRAQPGPQAELMMAGALRLARRFDEALAILDRLKKDTPAGEPFPHLIEFGYTYYDARQFDKARGVFQLVRDDLRYQPQTRTEATKQIANLNREKAIKSAYRAIEMRELDEARDIVIDLNEKARAEKDAKPDQNLIALNAILDAEQNAYVDAALATFEGLKEKTPNGQRFQFNSAYATQLLDKRRYPAALAALKLADPELNHYFTDEEVAQHREAIHFMKKFTNPIIETAVRLQDFSEGRAVRSSIIASTPLNQALTRLGVEYTYNELEPEIPTPGSAADAYHKAYLTARHQFSDHIHGSLAVGTDNGNFAYRASLGWSRPSHDQFAELTWASGRQPVDTLLIETLGAQEDRLSFAFSTELPAYHRLRLKGSAFVRQIDLDRPGLTDLGTGWGARVELEYLLYRKNRDVATISAYLGLEEFNFKSNNADIALLGFDPLSLVAEKYQAVGVTLYGEKALTSDTSVRGSLGIERRIDSDLQVYSVSGGVKHWISDDAYIHADATYSTSGQAANTGGGYFEGVIGVDLTL
jgi:hypothetical protein